MLCGEQRRRCCAFSAQFAINFGIKKRQSWYKKNVSTPLVLRFLSVIHHESPHYNHVFSKKAQHRWRWISLWTFTRGRLVPRQPRAIKRTTPTALHHEGIHNGRYIHGHIGIICYLLIRMLSLIVLWNKRANTIGVALLIVQGCQTIVQATLG